MIISDLLQSQKQFFKTGATLHYAFRLEMLMKLKRVVEKNESRIYEALRSDLNKSKTESYTSEISFITKEIDFSAKNLKKWMKLRKVSTQFINQPGKSYIFSQPRGTALIIAPWNYPLGLSLTPLVSSIAAGNCTVLKPSEIAPFTSQLIADIISDNFDSNYLAVVQGGPEVTSELISEQIDCVFFTGSTRVGKIILKQAAEHLLPVTLELGGKNPCIVDSEIDLEVTAKRIAFGKFFNAGQTCIAPDYLLVNRKIADDFIAKLTEIIDRFYPENSGNSDFTHIINEKHFLRLSGMLRDGKIIKGGKSDFQTLYIEPTLMTDITPDSPLLTEEIFGPILPIFIYDSLEDEIRKINSKPKPLSLYFFTKDKAKIKRMMRNTSSGGFCVNGTIHPIVSNTLPFGGVGASGMGEYHGKFGFNTFSHQKAVMHKSFWLDIPVAYPPYKTSIEILKKVMKFFY